VWKVVVIASFSLAGVDSDAHLFHAVVVRELWVVLAFVQVLDQKLDDGGFIFREVNLAFVGLLFIRQN
jgi:hypothetical protein